MRISSFLLILVELLAYQRHLQCNCHIHCIKQGIRLIGEIRFQKKIHRANRYLVDISDAMAEEGSLVWYIILSNPS